MVMAVGLVAVWMALAHCGGYIYLRIANNVGS
jgi:hypothetical protein